jgi:hypothetical protein
MDAELEARIERYLLSAAAWVPAAQICRAFGVAERQLRAVDGTPGLCSLIAISGPRGYKHFHLATRSEWDRYVARETAIHGGALAMLQKKTTLRQSLTRQARSLVWERDLPQSLLPLSTS